MEPMVEPMSQFTVVVDPTAAVAAVPSAPTMAVSIYCTAVCISCSSMVGPARRNTVPVRDRSGFFIVVPDSEGNCAPQPERLFVL